MPPLGLALAAALVVASAPAFGSNDDAGADPFAVPGAAADQRPLSITIESALQIGRLALTGRDDGTAVIDPQTGAKRVGGNMVDLGGLTFQGKATVTGQPLKPVRIELPQRVLLHSPSGAEAELSDFRTDLPGVALLDAHGVLEFSFGATLSTKGAQGGDFRGRIPIRVEYY
jgi:hypothetical protein